MWHAAEHQVQLVADENMLESALIQASLEHVQMLVAVRVQGLSPVDVLSDSGVDEILTQIQPL